MVLWVYWWEDSFESKYTKVDYSQYEEIYDFREVYHNEALNKLYDKNGAIYITSKNKILLKLSKNDKLVPYTKKVAETMLIKILKFNIYITDDVLDYKYEASYDIFDVKVTKISKYRNKFPISIEEIKYIHGEKYRPDIPTNIINEEGLSYINLAIPTPFMMLEGEPKNKPRAILDFLFNLVGEKNVNLEYFLQWLAFPLIYGKKPQVAVVLFGDEGTGKNILYSTMSKLYGEESCSQINSESLKSQYKLSPLLNKKRFINFDEITEKTSISRESLLKAVITNPKVELKGTVELHAQCLFTANYSTSFNIKEGDRRRTVFRTGTKLTDNNFLGFGSYEALEAAIEYELIDFVKYLKSLKIDNKLLQQPLDTPEKRMIIGLSNVCLQDFHDAIVHLNLIYFSKLRNQDIYKRLDIDFNLYYRIDRVDIKDAYNDLFGVNLSTTDIMNQLREITTENIFLEENIGHPGSKHYILPRGKIH